jgi:hypothetical protein
VFSGIRFAYFCDAESGSFFTGYRCCGPVIQAALHGQVSSGNIRRKEIFNDDGTESWRMWSWAREFGRLSHGSPWLWFAMVRTPWFEPEKIDTCTTLLTIFVDPGTDDRVYSSPFSFDNRCGLLVVVE